MRARELASLVVFQARSILAEALQRAALAAAPPLPEEFEKAYEEYRAATEHPYRDGEQVPPVHLSPIAEQMIHPVDAAIDGAVEKLEAEGDGPLRGSLAWRASRSS